MRTVVLSTRFKRDLKLAKKRGKDLNKLQAILLLLQARQPLPSNARDHALIGEKGLRDCHLEPDRVLLYEVDDSELRLIRLGTHSDILD